MNTTTAVAPATYPALVDPYAGGLGYTQNMDTNTYAVSTAYSPVPWNATTSYGMDGFMSTIKSVAQGSSTYRFQNTIKVNFLGTWANNTVVQAWTSYQNWDQLSAQVSPPTWLNALCQYTVGTGNSTNFIRTTTSGTNDIVNTTGAP